MGRISTRSYRRSLRGIHLSRLCRGRLRGCFFRFRSCRSGNIGGVFLIRSYVSRTKGVNHHFRLRNDFFWCQNMDRKPPAVGNHPFRGRFLGCACGAQVLAAPARYPRFLRLSRPTETHRQRRKLTIPALRIRDLLQPYCRDVPLDICGKIQLYMNLLSLWGKKIALTSVTSEEDVVRFHFGESIFALSLESFDHGRLADVGSGAGFPGLAIKLLCPNLSVTLLEPNKKKCVFLNEVIRTLQLTDVDISSIGFEDSQIRPNELRFVASRALGRIGDLLSWSHNTLSRDGRVIFWLGAEDAEETARIPGR